VRKPDAAHAIETHHSRCIRFQASRLHPFDKGPTIFNESLVNRRRRSLIQSLLISPFALSGPASASP
jgi:hypothetical protein